MKKLTILLAIFLSSAFIIQAQSTRMLLAEGFTSSTCGPCASQNPAFDALLHANTDKITSIKYHMSWPAPGNDPMYLHNTVDNNARRTYYSINSVPHVYLSGNYMHGTPSQISQTTINTYAANPSPFEITMQHRLNASQDSVFITMLIRATQDVSGNLLAHIAVIEKEVHFAAAPGTNGEKDFYNVMKALIPSRNGTALSDFSNGEYVIIEAAWKLTNVYNINQIAAVGFVQDNTTKHVHQAANSTEAPIVPYFANDATVKRIENATSVNCTGTMSPKATITNYGSSPLTSATVDFKVNDQTVYSAPWTGSLGFLESALVDAGQIGFPLQASNTLKVEISSVNGSSDQYPQNNSEVYPFIESPNLSGTLSLFILLNSKPEQTSWELLDGTGAVIQSGGPYAAPNGVVSVPLNITNTDCYEFVMYDAGGDGLCCNNGVGYYAVLDASSNALFTGQSFGYVDRNGLGYGYVGVNETSENATVGIHPNPASQQTIIQIDLNTTSNVSYEIRDLTGRLIQSKQMGELPAGTYQFSEQLNQLTKGIYLVNIITGKQTISRKLMVE